MTSSQIGPSCCHERNFDCIYILIKTYHDCTSHLFKNWLLKTWKIAYTIKCISLIYWRLPATGLAAGFMVGVAALFLRWEKATYVGLLLDCGSKERTCTNHLALPVRMASGLIYNRHVTHSLDYAALSCRHDTIHLFLNFEYQIRVLFDQLFLTRCSAVLSASWR